MGIRWETAALEMRRTFFWILLSKHYSALEKFILIWSQLSQNCNMSCQSFPLQVATGLPIVIIKGYVSMFMFNPAQDLVDGGESALCAADHCVYSFPAHNPVTGNEFIVTLN